MTKERGYEFHVDDEHIGQPYHEVSWQTLCSGFAMTTTSHGVPHIRQAKGE